MLLNSNKAHIKPSNEKMGISLLTIFTLLILYFDCLGGAIRYITAKIGIPHIVYLPFLLSLGYIAIAPFFKDKTYIKRPVILSTYIFFGLYLLFSFVNIEDFSQVAFGFYAWTPFFVGLFLCSNQTFDQIKPHFKWIWMIAVLGVVLDSVIKLPWMGETYDLFGMNIAAARDWDASNIRRLAGFSRASFTVASQIALLGCYLIITNKNLIIRLFLFSASLISIFLTTSKTPALGLLIAFAYIVIADSCHKIFKSKSLNNTISTLSIYILLGCVIFIPIFYLGTSSLGFSLNFTGDLTFINLQSMVARMNQMWPDAIKLIDMGGNGYEWITGRGFGGIGAGQQFTESHIFNAADNLFIYLYVTFGVFSIFFAYWIIKGIKNLQTGSVKKQTLFVSLLVYLLSLGITTSIIEGIYPLLFMGILSGLKKEHQAHKETVPKNLSPGLLERG